VYLLAFTEAIVDEYLANEHLEFMDEKSGVMFHSITPEAVHAKRKQIQELVAQQIASKWLNRTIKYYEINLEE